MKEAVLQFFHDYPNLALVSGFAVAFLVALIGLIPSPFVTAANVLFFGFWQGLAITFAGENLGAAVAFYLYRKGLKKEVGPKLHKYKTIHKLLEADNRRAFWLVFTMRLIPLIPSGFITFGAAMGRMSFAAFVAANSLGKLPSLILEAYAVGRVKEFDAEGKIILAVAAIALVYFVVRWILKRRKARKLNSHRH